MAGGVETTTIGVSYGFFGCPIIIIVKQSVDIKVGLATTFFLIPSVTTAMGCRGLGILWCHCHTIAYKV